jgi:hypothetical protein
VNWGLYAHVKLVHSAGLCFVFGIGIAGILNMMVFRFHGFLKYKQFRSQKWKGKLQKTPPSVLEVSLGFSGGGGGDGGSLLLSRTGGG